VAKGFERIIYDQLYAYLSDNNMITTYQSGFRSLHSTATALPEATNSWAYNNYIDRGNVNSVVFLDLKKAFDTVGSVSSRECLDAPAILATFTAGRTGLVACP